jgi:hypothetical protein
MTGVLDIAKGSFHFLLPFPVSRPYFEPRASPPICGPLRYRNFTGTRSSNFELKQKTKQVSSFMMRPSIIFLLKNAYLDNIPSSYIYTEEFNYKLLSVLVLEWLQSCDQKNGASGPTGGCFIALSIKGNRMDERGGGWGKKA